MTKTFRLTGLCCASCAAKIERLVGKLDGVKEANLNFMTTKLMIEGEEEKIDRIIDDTVVIVKKIEPDVVMTNA
ncbi:MAG: cation transporter [Oscillospiraceae bacterium]